ncbi:MAG: metalloregulator ArsR/SmtB family transcription factor [Candidatus Protistobacter heckmanni]|nr:metalloregulator ArsR/SmtB family transcription factor [Candidatus Protistobacter heckmanni]
MNESSVVKALAALAQPLRLRIFLALIVVGQEGLTPGTMAESMDIGATALSFHLKELVHAGLVTQQRDSRHLIYRAAFERMNDVLAYLADNCCQGKACIDVKPLSCSSC